MKLRDYFLLGLNKGLGKKRVWMNVLFNIVYNANEGPEYTLKPYFKDDQMYFYKEGDSNDVIEYIEDYIPNRAPLHFRDEFILQPGEIANYKGTEPLRTTYGNVFANHLILVEAFGDLFPFQAGKFDPAKLEDQILERMIDDREDGDVTTMAGDGKLYVWQYLKFADACLAIPGYADSLVTSVTKKSLTSSPERDAVREKWVKDNAHRLHDPAAIAELGVLMGKVDDEYLEGDEANEFYKSKKKLAGARRKVHYFFGGESPFSDGTTVTFIKKSLEEGIDTDFMPVMNNSLRFGSYNRGAQTAMGGESTKTIYRMVGTVRIIEPDCKTWIGIPTMVDDFNAKTLIGYSYVDKGRSILIEKDDLESLKGRIIDIRGPMTCKSGRGEGDALGKGKNICAVCAGKALAENPNGIPAAAAGVGGRFLMIFMSKMHSSVLRTVHWDMRRRIT
ncbi:RNA polymerase beta subunit [Pseudomonas phage PhiPA3]|uniref:Putative RNA polymerase beta subunit n=1 Tax=Pseudomonas phage PhiPA3 TaxID=998086 RepID=F8SJV6_BPPA3|nr:RNA polymerase beta subunit [Pseudomonas phage PhiPA3]AEH03501.1 putative RNA polymerase beta subunit [Pseudomonas phage PhiPA3]